MAKVLTHDLVDNDVVNGMLVTSLEHTYAATNVCTAILH